MPEPPSDQQLRALLTGELDAEDRARIDATLENDQQLQRRLDELAGASDFRKEFATGGERELIAAHVSALNGCQYCYVAHRRYAEAFGIAPGTFGDMVVDLAHEDLRPAMTAALIYAGKLTQTPSDVDQSDFDALIAAGWDEDAIHDIVSVTAMYGFMNRLLEGSGMKENVAAAGFSAEKARASKYSDMLQVIRKG